MKKNDEKDDFKFPDIGGFEDLNLDTAELNALFDIGEEAQEIETRYIRPKRNPVTADRVMYDNAEKLARDIHLDFNQRADVLVNGTFIFGDFIEAYLVEHQAICERMIITTLSLSQDNIDSLAGLMDHGYIKELDLIISAYFYGNEAYSLVPYMYDKLDKENRFQLAVADVHTKTCQFKTAGGRHMVMHGSANLRSSGNIENLTIEESRELYDFYDDAFTPIIEEYRTIKKAVRKSHQWDLVTRKRFKKQSLTE